MQGTPFSISAVHRRERKCVPKVHSQPCAVLLRTVGEKDWRGDLNVTVHLTLDKGL